MHRCLSTINKDKLGRQADVRIINSQRYEKQELGNNFSTVFISFRPEKIQSNTILDSSQFTE